jgi:hypothetical protein
MPGSIARVDTAGRPALNYSDYNSVNVQKLADYIWTVIPNALMEPSVLAYLFGLSLVLFIGSILLIPILIARMRADYFTNPIAPENRWFERQPTMKIVILVLKNFLGLVLLLAGLAMMVLPGQGIITVLVALTLLNFPGKRRLERRIISQQHVQRGIAWIRTRAGRPKLLMPKK